VKRVLFVDDEQHVLDGLKRMLHPLRNEWTTEFARNGREALERLSASDFDVLVTDVRMPELDGIELLTEVIRIHPQIVRIVLSGTADQEMTIRSISLAHQYLMKPCDAKTIRATLVNAFTLRNMLDDPSLTRLIGRIKSLPSAPSIYLQLMKALGSEEVSAADVGAIIAQDLGMTAKILQLVNSPLFGSSRVIAGPQEAVVYLGIEIVRSLALGESMFSQFGPKNHPGFSPEELRDHSFRVATLARHIAKALRFPPSLVADVFMGGLMHDIGKLVLGTNFPGKYQEVVDCFGDSRAVLETERRLFGTTHAEVGAYLLWLWGVPGSVTEIVSRHHQEVHPQPTCVMEPAAVVQLADRMVCGGESAPDAKYLAALGLPPGLLESDEVASQLLAS
jgi:putative nucleotidyltransferase with HDIG domain